MDGFDRDEARALLKSDPWASRLGIDLAEGDPLGLTMTVSEEHLNFLDGGHGGALYSLADAALMVAAALRGEQPSGLDSHLALTAGGRRGDVLTARVEEVSAGRSLGTFRVTVTRDDERVVGVLTGTTRFRQ